MTTIILTTYIAANIEKCFDAARDIDLHKLSAAQTNEKAIDGKISGLCEQGDWVTWEARHFGIKQRLSVEITQMVFPYFFEDCMLKGAFKSMKHEHYFSEQEGKTVMKDVFKYEVPFGFLGLLFDKIVLKQYMTDFLLKRNQVLKDFVEQQKL